MVANERSELDANRHDNVNCQPIFIRRVIKFRGRGRSCGGAVFGRCDVHANQLHRRRGRHNSSCQLVYNGPPRSSLQRFTNLHYYAVQWLFSRGANFIIRHPPVKGTRMVTFVRRTGNAVAVVSGDIVAGDGTRVPFDNLKTWYASGQLAQLAAYGITGFDDPAPPQGQVVTSVAYAPDTGTGVQQTVQTAPAVALTIVATATLISRLTGAEQTNIFKAANTAMAAGNASYMFWLTAANTRGFIDLADPTTAAVKAAIVSAGMMTQARADAVFVT